MTFPGLPPQASAHAPEITSCSASSTGASWRCSLSSSATSCTFLVRFRRGAHPTADYAGMRSHWSVYLVFAIALAEGVLLVAFEMPAWNDRVNNLPSAGEATVVRVVAEQFAWNVHYPGADRTFGRTDVNLIAADNPLVLDRTDPAAKDDITQNPPADRAGQPPRARSPHEQGCDPQFFDQRDAGETGCDARHRYAGVVHSDAHHRPDAPAPGSHRLRVRDWLLAAVRARPLPLRGFLNVKSDADYQAYLAEEARSQRR